MAVRYFPGTPWGVAVGSRSPGDAVAPLRLSLPVVPWRCPCPAACLVDLYIMRYVVRVIPRKHARFTVPPVEGYIFYVALF